jgi:two-component system sensor histidine kinase BaeS
LYTNVFHVVKKIKNDYTAHPMRFPIGLRLFFAVLLAILVVAASGIGLMRHRVLGSFSDYATQIELDRLGGLAAELGSQYSRSGGWHFIPDTGRAGFIRTELNRLARQESGLKPQVLKRPPRATGGPNAAPPAPTPEPALPPLPAPPVPPAPPAPPEAPSRVTPVEAVSLAAQPAPGLPGQRDLVDRVSLLDAQGNWLAGAPPGTEAVERRGIEAGDQTVGYLQVVRTMKPTDAMALAFLDKLADGIALIVVASIVLSALAAVLLANHFRKPIGHLAAGAGRLAMGDFDTRIEHARNDELGDLARAFNKLAERLGEAEGSRRQWVADTSHELRTPLSVLRAQLEAIQDGVRPADSTTVAAMLRQVLALNSLIDDLYALARSDVDGQELDVEEVDAWMVAKECALAFEDRIKAAGLTLLIGDGTTRTVRADAARLRQVFNNLLENSVRYTSAGGRIAVDAEPGMGYLAIWIEDSAPGVPDEALPRLTERFFRVDNSRSRASGGAGLGLALCERIAVAHDGALRFRHADLGGLRVTLTLPTE